MKVVVVYVLPVCAGEKYFNYALRFLEYYHTFGPGMDHDTAIILNGGKQTSELCCLFGMMPHCSFLEHDNSGYDIGAFQFAARNIPCDMMVFFGASTFFNRGGWLVRMVDAFVKHGNAQYGSMGNRGDLNVKVWPHIRTTAFWMNPKLMAGYPKIITRPQDRHPFEHGRNCFTSWVSEQGLKSWVVTWTLELAWENWDDDPNGFHRGTQSSLLAGDHICERPYYPGSKCKKHPESDCSPWSKTNCWECIAVGK